MIYAGVLLLLLLVAYLGFGWYFSGILIFPKTYDHDYAIAFDQERGRLDPSYLAVFDGLEKEEVNIPSTHGDPLHGLWIPNGQSEKTVVFCHGITWNLVGAIKYSEIFYNLGFNLLLYDHRNHGKSGGDKTTFGYYEKEDLKLWYDWIESRLGKGAYIGTHGESLGAATALQHLGIDSRVKFCIADCPYSDLEEVLKYRLGVEYKIRFAPLIPVTSLFTRLRAGLRIKDVSPIRVVSQVSTPIFWIHGAADDYVPAVMSEAMYQAKTNGYRRLWVVPEARHAGSYYKEKAQYTQEVALFLEAIGHETH